MIPYTYLIGWVQQDKWYYGVRYSKTCHPDDLWKTYFTSSKLVKEFREIYGEPTVIQVRKTFTDALSAREWESKVLIRMNAVKSDKFLNQSYSCGKFYCTAEQYAKRPAGRKRKPLTEEHRKRLSEVRRGRRKTQKHKDAIAAALTGKTRPIEVRQKMSETRKQKGIKSSTAHMNDINYYCAVCDKHMNKGNFIRWHSHQPP